MAASTDAKPAMRAIIAGGGTGGHVIPAIAIARELQAQYRAEILFVGTPRGIENRLVPAAGFPLKLVQVGALKNVSVRTRLKTMFDLPRAVLASLKIFREFRPNVVIGVGGYASSPAMLAAVLRRVPSVAFEPNVVPGFANRAVARFVTAAAVHFEETGRYFRNAKVTGVPVRREFFAIPQSNHPGHRVLLITGGSQGAKALNDATVQMLPQLKEAFPELLVIHQTGARDLEAVRAAYERAGMKAEVSAFIDDMPAAFARADLLLCRSGASTVAEISAAGKPAVFVPFPHAADDHQLRNAEALAHRGAAVVIQQKDLTSERLFSTIKELLSGARLAGMAESSRKLSHPEASREIGSMAARAAGIE
jgi:UDP-N-acetylglucosamine--N-acetylmuramyl-(pentapeptide) pyrophosphoryl-undecaprenol N-acetylglucosamine transferase